MTADQVAIVARLKANNAQLNLRPELRGELNHLWSPYASTLQRYFICDAKHEVRLSFGNTANLFLCNPRQAHALCGRLRLFCLTLAPACVTLNLPKFQLRLHALACSHSCLSTSLLHLLYHAAGKQSFLLLRHKQPLSE